MSSPLRRDLARLAKLLAVVAALSAVLYTTLARGLPLLGYDPQRAAEASVWFVGAGLFALGAAASMLYLWCLIPDTGRRAEGDEHA